MFVATQHFDMSLLFSLENCSLISHENFINRIYCNDSGDATHSHYKIRPELFELNVPYRQKSEDDSQSKNRHRKIINKTKNRVAEEQRDEYALVIFPFAFLFFLII